MNRYKQFVQNFLLLLSTFLVMAVAGEAAVRFFSDLSVPLIKRNQKLGTTYRENSEREIMGPESKQKVLIRINNDGFRTPSRQRAKPPGTVRIAVIGDSQIAAINTREHDTMPVLLEKKLNLRYPQVHWEVFNFGVSGANTAQEFNLYRELVRNYDMDVVVCAYYNGNDFSDNSLRLSRNPRIYMDFREGSDELITIYPAPSRKRMSNWLNEHSRLYVWQKYFIGDAVNNFLAAGGAGKNQKVRDEFLMFVDDPHDETLAYSWRINERIIRDFHEKVTADDAYFLFLSIPHGIETTEWQWEEYQRMVSGTSFETKINRRHPETQLRSFMEKHTIDYLFLRSVFEEHLQKTRQDDPQHYLAYREGRGHLNETGNLVMTDALLEHFGSSGIIVQLIEKAVIPTPKVVNGSRNGPANISVQRADSKQKLKPEPGGFQLKKGRTPARHNPFSLSRQSATSGCPVLFRSEQAAVDIQVADNAGCIPQGNDRHPFQMGPECVNTAGGSHKSYSGC